MIVQLPEWKNWRVVGTDREWEVQQKGSRNGEVEWRPTNYFPSLAYAMAFAYEKTLRASKKKAGTIEEALGECNRVKDAIIGAVNEAVGRK